MAIAPERRSIIELKFSANRDISVSPSNATRSFSSPSAAMFIALAICLMRSASFLVIRILMTATSESMFNAYKKTRATLLGEVDTRVIISPAKERTIPRTRNIRIRLVPVRSFLTR